MASRVMLELLKRIGVGVVGVVAAGGGGRSRALVGGDHVIAGAGESRHHSCASCRRAPGHPRIGRDELPARRLVACFEDVHRR